jgi:hypothetical protein
MARCGDGTAFQHFLRRAFQAALPAAIPLLLVAPQLLHFSFHNWRPSFKNFTPATSLDKLHTSPTGSVLPIQTFFNGLFIRSIPRLNVFK